METFTRNRAKAFSASIFLLSSTVSSDASAEPLVWGSGLWGDTWQNVMFVPALSPLALGQLAAALAMSVMGAMARRRVGAHGPLANGDRR